MLRVSPPADAPSRADPHLFPRHQSRLISKDRLRHADVGMPPATHAPLPASPDTQTRRYYNTRRRDEH